MTQVSDKSDQSDQELLGKMSLGREEAQNEGRRIRALERLRYISQRCGLVLSVNHCLSRRRGTKSKLRDKRASHGRHSSMRVTPGGVAGAMQTGGTK